MKALPNIVRKNGFTYKLIQREGKVAIYEQGYAENLKYFEVFLIKIKKPSTFKGKNIPAREIFPANENFGQSAWCKRTFEEAMIKFRELVDMEQGKGYYNDRLH